MPFPKHLLRVKAPPIKCQGIKTKLVGFISQNIRWDERGRWVEPFLGSGVVLFNFNPQKAVASDTNKHIVNFYQQIQTGKMTSHIVREFLEKEGSTLREKGADHYYFIR